MVNDVLDGELYENSQRRRSKVESYAHFVWATKRRAAFLTPEFEPTIYRCIAEEAQALGCRVLAIGGMPDHVHLVLRMPGSAAPSVVAKRVKGMSSLLFNRIRPEGSEPFRWQNGYAYFSLWYSQADRAVAYVQNQKEHHANGTLYTVFEQFDEPDEPEQPRTFAYKPHDFSAQPNAPHNPRPKDAWRSP